MPAAVRPSRAAGEGFEKSRGRGNQNEFQVEHRVGERSSWDRRARAPTTVRKLAQRPIQITGRKRSKAVGGMARPPQQPEIERSAQPCDESQTDGVNGQDTGSASSDSDSRSQTLAAVSSNQANTGRTRPATGTSCSWWRGLARNSWDMV